MYKAANALITQCAVGLGQGGYVYNIGSLALLCVVCYDCYTPSEADRPEQAATTILGSYLADMNTITKRCNVRMR